MGAYSLQCHNVEAMREAGITLLTQRYKGPSDSKPVPGLLGLHDMINDGLEITGRRLKEYWDLAEI